MGATQATPSDRWGPRGERRNPRLGRPRTPRPATSGKMSPAVLRATPAGGRGAFPLTHPGYAISTIVAAPHSMVQPGRPRWGSGGCHTLPLPPWNLGESRVQAMEWMPPPSPSGCRAWCLSSHPSVGDVQTLLSQRNPGSSLVPRSLLCRPSLSHLGLLSGR